MPFFNIWNVVDKTINRTGHCQSITDRQVAGACHRRYQQDAKGKQESCPEIEPGAFGKRGVGGNGDKYTLCAATHGVTEENLFHRSADGRKQ